MHLNTLSFSRLLPAGLIFCLVTVISAGCDKDDNHAPPPTVPLVTTTALTNITPSGATGGGSIVSDGGASITASGIVWSKTNAMPTLADSVVAGTSATGIFTVEISGLEFDNSYYVRAFATNSVGTGYGEVLTLNTITDTNKVRFTYNGEEVVYGVIVSPTTGRKWLDRNLGATQVATAFDDYNAYGDLFQWGRPDDGHQLINWTASNAGAPVNGTTQTLAMSDVPGHSNFIIYPDNSTNYDWRSDNNRNRWTTNRQGPCPAGWHVPTITEWQAEISNTRAGGTAPTGTGILDNATGYSQLKLTAAGVRLVEGSIPVFKQLGKTGFYWSTSDVVFGGINGGLDLEFGLGFVQQSEGVKATAMSVRCLKD